MSSSSEKHLPILKIGAAILTFAVGGIIGCAYFGSQPDSGNAVLYALAISLISVALVSFYSFMWYFQSLGGDWSLHKNGMRLSIVVSVITVFLDLVCTTMFFRNSGEKIPELTQTLITHFTTVVMMVIAFYFGTSAYVQVNEKKEKKFEADESKK